MGKGVLYGLMGLCTRENGETAEKTGMESFQE
jgi:hypothetical protein